ncbi:TPA: AAA family ATPase [Vibrio parahaemolyticus]|nr:AAA family ATPase [Vibrio parahaemolyticus]HBC3873813.1 AAA family ATPase [Vibrio parahaemolyticus]
MSTINTQLLAIKKAPYYETQGFITPILQVTPDGDYVPLDRTLYPVDIFISKGYGAIDKQYEQSELFILKSHVKDEQKSREVGEPRYWADDGMVSPLTANTLLPVLSTSLPSKETGTLERGVEPPKGAFFILDSEYLYGPLKSSYTDDDQYVVEPNVNPLLSYGRGNLGRWLLEDVQSCLVKTEVDGEQCIYVKSFKHLSNFRGRNGNSADFIDYLSDDQLIKVANQTHFGKKGLSKKEAEKLQQIITSFEKENKNLHDERLERLKSMLDKYLMNGSNGYNLIKEYLEAPTGQKFLKDYVQQNESRLLQGVLDEFEKDANEKKEEIEIELDRQRALLDKYQDDIVKLQDKVLQKRKWAQDELDRIAQETEEERQRKLEENQAELGEKIAQMETELEARGRELASVCDRLEIANDIKELKAESDYYERYHEKQQTKVNNLIAGYNKAIREEDDALYKRIGDMQAFNKLLNGKSSTRVETAAPVVEQLPMSSVQPDSAADLVDYLCSQFSDSGRGFSFDEMSNLVVCLQQSFLTVLAGGPGTGKTSTVTRLAKAMNLGTGQLGDHFLNVPVGRGWVSSRDILGFYNSLKDTYQESRSGLYSFLSHHQMHPSDTTKIILLDEANLSSIEHYWSDFLIYCDRENLLRSIDTGIPNTDQRYLKLDDMTRFIATINFDSTTEPLSPRLIDRVPVITLDNPEANIGGETSSLNLDGMLSASKIKEMFTVEDNALLRSEQILLQDTVDILSKADRSKGPAIVVSQRKLNSIANYVSSSRDLMGSETAMDFAISQFILPHIDGYGSAFKCRLEELADKVSKHSRTEGHLERILTSGDYLSGSYSFFG